MKKILLILLLTFYTTSIVSQSWIYNYENAKKMALATNKLILVDFTASWCAPCKKMDSDVWSDLEVQKLMNEVIPLKIDVNSDRNVANIYNVRGIPNILILDSNGKIIINNVGYQDKNKIIKLLNKFALSTSFLQKELINYFKKPNYSSTLRLANKYQMYSLYVNENVKNKFLILSSEYFSEAFKLIKKSDSKNKEALLQKINLFKIRKKVFQNKPKKVLKSVGKLEDNEILSSNKSLYSFLHYTSYMQLDKEDEAKIWFSKLNDSDKKIANLVLKKVILN